MATAEPSQNLSEFAGFPIRLASPLPIGVAGAILIVAWISLRCGLPIYWRQVAIREIDRVAYFSTSPAGPAWLRAWIGDDRMRLYYEPITHIVVADSPRAETWMKWLKFVPDVQVL